MNAPQQFNRHERLSSLFLKACDLSADEREAFLQQQCADDPELVKEILSLLPYDDQLAIVDQPLVRISGSHAKSLLGPTSTPPLQRIGQFEVLGILGQGGMGTVYRVRQQHPDRLVALKVMQNGLPDAATIRRFQLEASLLGRLRHPGIAQIYEAGTADTGLGVQPYFAMELIPGRSLLSYAQHNKLSTPDRLNLIVKICDAVQHAHEHGIVHRDLKPSNILVDEGTGQPKILDFGVARVTDADPQAKSLHTRNGQLLGTLPYMSPEQLEGDSTQVEYRSDVYALGVIAYELLTGRLPHDLEGKPVIEAARLVQSGPVARLSSLDRGFRGDIETIVAKAMEQDPARRYQSPVDLAQDIRRHLTDQPIQARSPTTMYQLRKFARRNRAVVVGTAVAATLLVAAVIGTSYGLVVARGERDEARRAAENAKAVRQFLLDVLATPSPGAVGRDVKVVDALLAAEEEIAKAFSDQPEIRADVHVELAVTLAKLGKLDVAEQYARHALQIRTETLGPSHIETIRSMNLLGNILVQSDGADNEVKLEEARLLLDRTITRCQALGDNGKEELISLLSNRGHLAFRLNDLDEAQRLAREMLDLALEITGADSLETLSARQNLAMLLNRQGQREQAEPEFRQIADQLSSTQGNRDPATLRARRNRAMSLNRMAQYDKAEAIYRQNIPLANEVLGENHIEVVRWLNDYGFLLKESKRYDEAVETYRDALVRAEAALGPVSFLSIVTKDSLCIALMALDRFDEARPLLRECVDGLAELQGPAAAPTLRETYKLVDLLLRTGEVDEAMALSDEQRTRAEEAFAVTDPVVAISRVAAIRSLLAANRTEDARHVIVACVRDCPPHSSNEHYLLGRALQDLVDDCERAGLAESVTAIRDR